MKKVTRKELMEMVEKNEDYSQVDVSEITNFSFLFKNKTVSFDISKWKTSSAKNMKSMFEKANCRFMLGSWDVSNVENMSKMFSHSKYNHPLNDWDVSNVKNLTDMFCCSNYRHPLDHWRIQKDGWAIQEVFEGLHLLAYPKEIDFKELYHAASFSLRIEHKKDFIIDEVEKHLLDRCLLELNFLETEDFSAYRLECDSEPNLIKMKGYGRSFYFINQKNYYFKVTNEQVDFILKYCLAT